MPTHAHRTLRNADLLADVDEGSAEKSTEKCSVSGSFFLQFIFSTRPEPTETDRRFRENRNTDRATLQFRFTTLRTFACIISDVLPPELNYLILVQEFSVRC